MSSVSLPRTLVRHLRAATSAQRAGLQAATVGLPQYFRLEVRAVGCAVPAFGQATRRTLQGQRRAFGAQSAASARSAPVEEARKDESIVEIDYRDLQQLTPATMELLRKAFVGPKSYGAIAVINIPGYGDRLRSAFRAGIDLALTDPEGRRAAASVNNTYPGWSGTPGEETHPLQSSFLFNVKEEIPSGKPDPYFGKNIFPSPEFRKTFVDLATPMHDTALQVLGALDALLDEEMEREQRSWSSSGRSLRRLGAEGPALAGRFICYDSGFTREDTLLQQSRSSLEQHRSEASAHSNAETGQERIVAPTSAYGGVNPYGAPSKAVGHAGDGLASMRTHSTPVKSAGHAGDGLASMRTHSTPVKSAGHAGDGLASMRTHSTPVKSAGHAGDGLASMRTHSTPVKSAGHAGDGLASMRTHSTPVKSAGHAGDGLASMRTHSTPVKSAGHAGDGLASMRTHATPVKSAGHAGDGLASMRTHSTPVKSAGHAGDGLASMRTHSTPVKSAGHAGDNMASARAHSTLVEHNGHAGASDTMPMPLSEDFGESESKATGDYWLPWHIDSNFVTLLHKEMYAYERDASWAPEPEGAGLLLMNQVGDVGKLVTQDDALIVQMGAFAQIYAGGRLTACRHAVVNPAPQGVSRFNYCNFWYVPWNTVCTAPSGLEQESVNTGWNAMMDASYLDITMRQSFAAFRQFMVSPEARLQFADSERFKELSELLPLPPTLAVTKSAAARPSAKIVVDMLTDIRCPFAFLSQTNLMLALQNMGLQDEVLLRFHPVFLNPNVSREGESLDDYLLREYGYTKEYAHSEAYPIRQAGLKVGVNFNPNRRVINTFDAHCLIEVARLAGKQHEVVKALARRYFEEAEDISDERVLCAAAAEVGLAADAVQEWLRDPSVRARLESTYLKLAEKVQEIPHFVLRERVSGNGVEVGGNRSPEEWQAVLETVLEKGRFMGMTVPGPFGREVRLPLANPNAPVSLALPAQHGWRPESWPFKPEDFSRMDESPDTAMYAEPRLVHHLDSTSLDNLTEVYRNVFQELPQGFSVLDLCSSWASHYPQEHLQGARVVVHGLNEAELKANRQATERHVQDLNASSRLPWESASFDAVTMALSVQYLTDPRSVFSEMHRVLKPGGVAVVAFSHRTFIEKAVRLWAEETYDGEGHTHLVARYFQHGPPRGWQHISSADVSPRHGDPLWIVTAVKAGHVA